MPLVRSQCSRANRQRDISAPRNFVVRWWPAILPTVDARLGVRAVIQDVCLQIPARLSDPAAAADGHLAFSCLVTFGPYCFAAKLASRFYRLSAIGIAGRYPRRPLQDHVQQPDRVEVDVVGELVPVLTGHGEADGLVQTLA